MRYILSVGADGKLQKQRMSTGQVKQKIKLGELNSTAKVARHPKGNYVPIAGDPEFEQLLREKHVQAKVEQKSEKYKKLYADIERQQYWCQWKKRFRRKMEGIGGMISLVLYLAVIGGIIIGAWTYAPTLIAMIRAKAGM